MVKGMKRWQTVESGVTVFFRSLYIGRTCLIFARGTVMRILLLCLFLFTEPT